MRTIPPNLTEWFVPAADVDSKPKGFMVNTLLVSFRVACIIGAILAPVLLFIKSL